MLMLQKKLILVILLFFPFNHLAFSDIKRSSSYKYVTDHRPELLSDDTLASLYSIEFPNPFIELTEILMSDNGLASIDAECVKHTPLIRYTHYCPLGNGSNSGSLFLIVEYGRLVEYLIEADFRTIMNDVYANIPLGKYEIDYLKRLTREIAIHKFESFSTDDRKIFFDGYDIKIHHILHR